MKNAYYLIAPGESPPVEPAPNTQQVKPEKEGWGSYALRTGSRLGARSIEAALGVPGDIGSLLTRGLGKLEEVGEWTKQYQQPSELMPETKPVFKEAAEYFPTSEKIREKITKPLAKKYLPEKYLEPRGDFENSLDNFVSTVVASIVPLGPLGLAGKGAKIAKKLSIPLKKAAYISGAGNLGGYLAKKLGAGPKTQAGVTIGMGLLAATTDLKSLKQLIKKMPAVDSKSYNLKLQNFKIYLKNTKETLTDPRQKAAAQALLDEIELVRPQKIVTDVSSKPFSQLVKEARAEAKQLKKAPVNIEKLRQDIKESGATYVKHHVRRKRLPLEFSTTEKERLLKQLEESGKITTFLKNNVVQSKLNPITGSLYSSILGAGISMASGNPWIQLAGMGSLGINAYHKLSTAFRILSKNPQLRKMYAKSLMAAFNNNKTVFWKSIDKINKIVEKEKINEFPGEPNSPKGTYFLISPGISV